MEEAYIAWYNFNGEEDFTIIFALDIDEATRRFYANHDHLIDIHKVAEDDSYLTYI